MPSPNPLFRSEVLALSAYPVADAQGLIKLDAMENPYSWPDALKNQWWAAIKDCPVNRYPDPAARRLTETLRGHDQINPKWGLLLGNGSDEIIQMLLMALPPNARVLAPVPGFVMYKQISDSLGLSYQGIALKADNFSLDLGAMLTAIEQNSPAIIFIAYPNNPTGNLFEAADIAAIIDAAPGLVVIDEAYAPFANASFLAGLDRYPHLLVMRTVSKLGLAGLRLGYLVGDPAIIGELNKIRLPYNINSLTQLTADFALQHKAVFEQQTQTICSERGRVFAALQHTNGITAYPSAANFILFKTLPGQANAVFAAIKQQGVLIKNLNPQGGLLVDCLRVTIGKPEENDAFLQALAQALLSR